MTKQHKDTYENKREKELEVMEIELASWRRESPVNRQKLSKHIASLAQQGKLPKPSLNAGLKYDPNTYNRVYSSLMNLVSVPEDYGFTSWKHTLQTL